MAWFKTKKSIEYALTHGKTIQLEAAKMVGGAVTFEYATTIGYGGSRYKSVQCSGFFTKVEENIDSLKELVDYIWRERKRIIDVY